jgi:hypothetical protein
MSGFSEQLTAKQQEAVLALLSNRTVEEAARVVGVHARTLFRWMEKPLFKTALRDAKRAAYLQSMARLPQISSAAVTTLAKVMLDPATPPGTKVRAADSILNHAGTAVETEDIEARISDLERVADESRPGWRKR